MFNSVYSIASDNEDLFVYGDVVFAYFKTYSVSSNVSGLGSKHLISYVLVLNVTNPNNKTISLCNSLISLYDSAVKEGNSISGETEIIRNQRNFANNDMSYHFYPRSSKLVSLTATGEIDDFELKALKTEQMYFMVHLTGQTEADNHVNSELKLKKVALKKVSETEYLYNTAFMNSHIFSFRNDTPNIHNEW